MILLTVYSLFSSLLAFRYSYPNFADSLPKKGLSRQQLFSRKPCVRKASFGLSAVGVFTRSPSSFSQGLGFSVPAAPAAKSRGCLIRFRIARTSVVRRLAAASAASGYNEVNNERMTYIPLPCQRAWNPARHASCLGAAKVMKRWTSVMRRSKKSPNHLRPKARTLRCARPFPSKRCFSRFGANGSGGGCRGNCFRPVRRCGKMSDGKSLRNNFRQNCKVLLLNKPKTFFLSFPD